MAKTGGRPFFKMQTLTSIISTGMVLVLLGMMVLLGMAARMPVSYTHLRAHET